MRKMLDRKLKLHSFIFVVSLLSLLILASLTTTTISDTEISASKVTFTSQFYYGSNNRTDTLAYPYQSYDYIVFKSGSNYYAKNGATGQIDSSGSNVTTVFQYAIDHGDSLFIQGGTYYTSSGQITLDSNTVVMGEPYKTIFDHQGSSTYHILYATGKSNIQISGITFKNTTGTKACIYCLNCSNIKVYNNIFESFYQGVECASKVVGFSITDNEFKTEIAGVTLNCILLYAPQEGIISRNYVHDLDAYGLDVAHPSGICVTTASGVGENAYDVIISDNVVFNVKGAGISVGVQSGYETRNVAITGNVINHTRWGIDIEGTGSGRVKDVSIQGNTVINTQGPAVVLTYTNSTTVVGNTLKNAGQNASAIYRDGIIIDHSDYFNIAHNIIMDDQTSPTQQYGIEQLGASSYGKIESNTFLGNVLAPITFESTNLEIRDNFGFVTENYVTATNTTATTFVFNHGLAGAPSYGHGGVWCSFNTTAITGYSWTATSTQITITVTGTGLPEVMACYCQAIYEP